MITDSVFFIEVYWHLFKEPLYIYSHVIKYMSNNENFIAESTGVSQASVLFEGNCYTLLQSKRGSSQLRTKDCHFSWRHLSHQYWTSEIHCLQGSMFLIKCVLYDLFFYMIYITFINLQIYKKVYLNKAMSMYTKKIQSNIKYIYWI